MKVPSLPTRTTGWQKPTRHALAVVLTGFVLLLACSRQEEGDRCDTKNDDNDCESGLVCVDYNDLRGGKADQVSRCCNPEGNDVNDARCTRLIGGGTTTSTTTTGGGGEAGANGTTGSTSCTHTSQCPEGMVCGPTGLCQAECLDDRDCDDPLVCEAGRCVSR